jgi:O-antigen/teichoic acid export membrane protein
LTGLNRVIAAQAPQFVVNPALVLVLVAGAAAVAALDAADAVMLSALIPMTALAGIEIFSNQLDMFMLGVISDKAQVGFYRVAFSGAALIILCRTVVDAALAPQIARLWHGNDREGLQELVRWSSRLGLAAAIPTAGALLIFGPSLIDLAYGEAYLSANLAMAALCVGQLVNAWAGPARSVLQLTGHEREAVRGAVFSGLVNVVLNASLIPFFGALGAALATTVALAGVNLWLCRRLRKLTGLRSAAL